MIYAATSIKPGQSAAWNRSPTGTPSTSPNRINTIEGGIICPRVPDAQMVPHANPLS
ncbi:Uncharacterised protein [Vibrio cholerae]|nr:Uncharacterised protein [Vibrio cholerae]CSB52295.1 Uncharacterised protein [Vibrio cholerae]CSB60545.1 Uncharacterised protein [Vibrio cholerae]